MKKIIILSVWVMVMMMPHGGNGEGFGVNAQKVYPRIITPNGDGWNDLFWVFYENPMDSEVHGKIYDIDGAEVTDMVHKSGAEEYSLCWDGTDGSKRVVPAGVYIYQITAEGSVYNGTIIVAR